MKAEILNFANRKKGRRAGGHKGRKGRRAGGHKGRKGRRARSKSSKFKKQSDSEQLVIFLFISYLSNLLPSCPIYTN
jgi:hypothetical protein